MMNFAFWLLLLSALTGAIYLLDICWWSKHRAHNVKPHKIIEYARSFFPVFITVLVLRSFLIEPFRIPSGSLEPTLMVGDFILVNKFIYGIRLPVWEHKIIGIKHPRRGDIVVFRWPPNPEYDYIKRVIGLPGDHIRYHDKKLTINNKDMTQKFLQYTIDESSDHSVAEYQEDLFGVKHAIYVRAEAPAIDLDVIVPEGNYFVMGDNRDDSADSRYWGFVPDTYLRGKAMLVWLSWDKKTWRLRWKNMGRMIQ